MQPQLHQNDCLNVTDAQPPSSPDESPPSSPDCGETDDGSSLEAPPVPPRDDDAACIMGSSPWYYGRTMEEILVAKSLAAQSDSSLPFNSIPAMPAVKTNSSPPTLLQAEQKMKAPVEALRCLYCNKAFASKQGIMYHLQKMVCLKRGVKKDSSPPALSQAEQKMKAPVQALRCPYCNKAFASKQGIMYHLQKMVCLKRGQLVAANQVLFGPGAGRKTSYDYTKLWRSKIAAAAEGLRRELPSAHRPRFRKMTEKEIVDEAITYINKLNMQILALMAWKSGLLAMHPR